MKECYSESPPPEWRTNSAGRKGRKTRRGSEKTRRGEKSEKKKIRREEKSESFHSPPKARETESIKDQEEGKGEGGNKGKSLGPNIFFLFVKRVTVSTA